ncbi:RNA polymerase sigma factor [Aquibaculum arenosum]|uniref:RNA polymerase sigma factor n=1 Tax=Aquibaculum arenosum TaxID=3032591 RepID=A0ABT5YP98_9PROT|nr:RNA polymerase sigma factor [Fodinicurvata sp. CAU 1616]MDF2096712.1 RNA polymerase sigma factor [Fodinicurvata sp. CAU 1616]
MGDPAERLIEEVRGLRRYALALTGSATDADDLVQESLQRVLAVLRKGAKVNNLHGYLYSVAHNTWMEQRARPSGAFAHLSLEDLDLQLPLAANQPARAEWHAMAQALQALPREQREVLLLIGLEGFSYKEAAALLSVPIGTVMSRLSRARVALRHALDGKRTHQRRAQ